MTDAFNSLVRSADVAAQKTINFVMFTPLKPVGFKGWLRPWRYEMHLNAIASSLAEAEEFKTWQLRAWWWKPARPYSKVRHEVAYLFAPVIPELHQSLENLKQYLVMRYEGPSFTGCPRGQRWDAMVVWAKNSAGAVDVADAAGLTPMKRPWATIVTPVPSLPTVHQLLTRPGIVYMQTKNKC